MKNREHLDPGETKMQFNMLNQSKLKGKQRDNEIINPNQKRMMRINNKPTKKPRQELNIAASKVATRRIHYKATRERCKKCKKKKIAQ